MLNYLNLWEVIPPFFLAPHRCHQIVIHNIRETVSTINVMRCAIWYHLYNLKNVKNTHGGVLILVKLQANVSFDISQIVGRCGRPLTDKYLNNSGKGKKKSILI